MVPLSPPSASIAPGTTVHFTAAPIAPPLPPPQSGETDAQYLARIRTSGYVGIQQLNISVGGPGEAFTAALTPALNIQKSGPASGNAGLALPYTVSLQNIGAADASSLGITDAVNGTTIPAQVTAPPTVAAGTTGTATIAAPSPLGQTPGPYTDQASVTWQDRNGNVYGPVSSSFTTNLLAGHPEGYLTLVTSTVTSAQILGTSVTLTATALDSSGIPSWACRFQLVIAGSNAQTVPLVTGADGSASFTYDGPNLGADTVTVTATINGPTLTATVPTVTWSTDVGTPCTGRATPLDVMLMIDDSPSMFTEDNVGATKAARHDIHQRPRLQPGPGRRRGLHGLRGSSTSR